MNQADVLNLLYEATAQGLKLQVLGNKIRITGPETAAPWARRLIQEKSEIIDVLGEKGEGTVRTVRRAPNMDLDQYLALLQKEAILTSHVPPPSPPFRNPPERGIAWAAWWEAIEQWRRHRPVCGQDGGERQ